MIVIDANTNQRLTLNLGRQGENEVTEFAFDYTKLISRYGDGILSGLMQRKPSEEPYPITLTAENGIAHWVITSVETEVEGKGNVQLIYTVDGAVKKSVIHDTRVSKSLTGSSEEPPDPYVDWVERMVELGAQVSEDVQTAEGLVADVTETASQALTDITTAKNTALDQIQHSLTFTDPNNDGNITIALGGN